MNLSKAIAIRLYCVFDHIYYTVFQYVYDNKELQDKLKLNKYNTEESRKACSIIGWITTVSLHCIHNFKAVLTMYF